jgi:uncharacterized repeat protein (TIGR01451 family)
MFRRIHIACLLSLLGAHAAHAQVNNACYAATSGGAAASDWSTFCWLDFTGYNNTTARSAAGQTFSFVLNDGSTLSLNIRNTTASGPAFAAVAAPSWSGAAMGNSSFIGIPGRPVLYTAGGGTGTLLLRNITVTPPGGVTSTAGWAIVAADAESTNNGESLNFVTNGAAWQQLQNVPPISGNTYPPLAGVGTTTVTETGVAGTVGSYIFSSRNSPSQISSTMTASGLQGVMFAVRYAWVSVNKTLNGTRLNPADQFTYSVKATANGTQLASRTSSGTGSGPFTAAQTTVASGYPVTVTEVMAAGSGAVLSAYTSRLTCTNNNAGSPTPMPTNQAVTSFNLGTLAYGDGVTCLFTNTPKRPTLAVSKTSTVTSDPFNGGTNPKRVPGSVVSYVVTVTNSGPGTVDGSTLVITDPVPANTALCVSTICSNPVVQFVDGTPASGLTFNAATNVSYSSAPGGGAPFTYTPVPDSQGFDAAVTGIRITTSGTMAAAGSGNPSFSVRFRARVQ